MIHILVFLSAFFITFLMTPFIRYAALRYDIIDKQNHRTIHRKVITKLGGASIYAGIVFAMLVAVLFSFRTIFSDLDMMISLMLGGTFMLVLGIYDDVRGANAKVKFAVQIVAALIVVQQGFVVDEVTFFGHDLLLGNFAAPVTVFWILTVTNAFNLIDGLDGLAAGLSAIASISFFVVFLFFTKSAIQIPLTLAICGASLGFLKYNYHPAKIFMGDTGSLMIGFFFATISIEFMRLSADVFGLIIPLALLFIPLFDTSCAFFRRILRLKNPFQADSEHIHHKLLVSGLSQEAVFQRLCFASGSVSFVAIILKMVVK